MATQYQALAEFYDALTADVDYSRMADYLLRLCRRHGAAPETVLDLGCGSGSLCRELLQRGLDVIGVDISPEMLMKAREKLAEYPETLLLCQSMQELDLYGTVDACFCTLDGFSHLTTTADAAAALDRISLFVRPGGMLVFDVNTPYKHRAVLSNRSFSAEAPGVFCTWDNWLKQRTCEIVTTLHLFAEREDGTYDRIEDVVRERAYTLSTWGKLLQQADFTQMGVYAAGTELPPDAACERWVIVARNDTRRYEQRR